MPLPVIPENIPAELRSLDQWIVWRTEERDGRATKVPYCPRSPRRRASTTNPDTWSPFNTAFTICGRGRFDGLGFVFTAGDRFTGVDLDRAVEEDGELEPWAADILARLDSYTELSPSDRGLHIIVRSDSLPTEARRRDGPIEAYSEGRYFTMTGQRYPGTRPDVAARSDELRAFLADYLATTTPVAASAAAGPLPVDVSDQDLIDAALTAPGSGLRTSRLWHGDTGGYNSHSDADMALCCDLAFWTGKDPDRIDALFRRSGLMRPKWTESRGGTTYGRLTIEKAIGYTPNTYSPAGVTVPAPNGRAATNGHSPLSANGHGPDESVFDDPFDTTTGEAFDEDEEPAAESGESETAGKGGRPRRGPTELALAEEWVKEAVGRWMYCEGETWWRYEAGKWSHRGDEFVAAEIQHFLIRLRKVAKQPISVTPSLIRNVRALAGSFLGPHRIEDFNSRPLWIPLTNGVYDVATGALLPHAPENMLTHQLPFSFDPTARCPRWVQFIRECLITTEGEPCPEWIGAVQEWFGYCLIPDCRAQLALFWVGGGANGKGVGTRVLANLVGKGQYTAVPIDQLHDPYHRAALYGKLVGFINEPDPRAMAKNAENFKAIVGGDQINARRPTEKPFDFTPTLRLLISCNTLPRTNDQTYGYFRRVTMMEWRKDIPPEERDRMLDDKLAAELPGIFNWALEGLVRFQERGYRFDEMPESDKLLAEYRVSEDVFARFLQEECEIGPDYRMPSGPLYREFVEWCKEEGIRQDRIPARDPVFKRLTKMGIPASLERHPETRIPTRYRIGIRTRTYRDPQDAITEHEGASGTGEP